MNTKNIVIGAVCLILGLGGGGLIFGGESGNGLNIPAGASPGNLLAEQYDPYVQYNGGYKSNKPMQIENDLTIDTSTLFVDSTNNRVGVGSTSPVHELSIDVSSGTSTAYIGATASGKGACIQLRTTDGKNLRIWASTTPALSSGTTNAPISGLIVEAGLCE